MYLNVIVDNKSKHTDNFFTYKTDRNDISIGDKVVIPFGRSDKEKTGFVFSVSDTTGVPEEKLKDVTEKIDHESLNEEMIKVAVWMKKRYAIKYYDAIRLFTAPGKLAKSGKEKEPYKDIVPNYVKPDNLTKEQDSAVKEINQAIDKGEKSIFLIHGVTSSGKTEVYMEAIERTIQNGKSAIMLVPEISLTPQMIERFAGRFGKENIAVMHSKLTPRERYDEWQRIRSGRAKIVVGARMGIFAPFDNLGLIVMDEEHEGSYKADMTPKYDTVEVAARRLQESNGVLILGSATPSVVSYQRAQEGIYKLIELKERYNKTPLPKLEIVDMRRELREGNTTIFSNALYKAISDSLETGEQVILLQNRRGYSNFVSCRECGKVMKCPTCDISLTYHKSDNSMVCHYCGRKYDVPRVCPGCNSKYIKYFGIGTEQVVETAEKLFPDAKVDRLDIDAVKKRADLEEILGKFQRRETDILVGTQLVAKGLDFTNVGVVGVIAADSTLNIPDYRSEERTFQLVTQVAGRAGRGDKQGKVFVQTYDPSNYALQAAKYNDYKAFFNEEVYWRINRDYPPFGYIIAVNVTTVDDRVCERAADELKDYLVKSVSEDERSRILSPRIAMNFKGTASYRRYVLIKSPKEERNRFVFLCDSFAKQLLEKNADVNITIDVNPYGSV